MDRAEFTARLRQIDPESRLQIATLAREVTQEAREPVQAAVAIWKGSDPKMAHKALLVLNQMEDVVVQPLVEAPTPPKPDDRVWMMHTAVTNDLALREQVATRLRRLLDDKTAVPIAAPPIRWKAGDGRAAFVMKPTWNCASC